jgi:hypothetical protein
MSLSEHGVLVHTRLVSPLHPVPQHLLASSSLRVHRRMSIASHISFAAWKVAAAGERHLWLAGFFDEQLVPPVPQVVWLVWQQRTAAEAVEAVHCEVMAVVLGHPLAV